MMSFNRQPTLEGESLHLRPLVPEDRDALLAAASDPEIWAVHPEPTRWQPAVFQRYFEAALASGGALVVVERASGTIIGSSRYHGFDPDTSQIEIGWTFLARSHWGGRTNGELKRLMIDHALQTVCTVVFMVGRDNLRSRRAVEKIGGVLVAENILRDGVDYVRYDVRS
jgi:RimJ/RimL family protein N-acetyltransferase